MINWLIRNIRFYVLLTTFDLTLGIYLFALLTIPDWSTQIVFLTRTYGFVALIYLYFSLLASPLTHLFRNFPFHRQYIKARRAIGISTFHFAYLHGILGFFVVIGGFDQWMLISTIYKIASILGFIALIILFLMTASSFDYVVGIMTFRRWKMLHRFVYIAGVFVLIHAFIRGTHFQNLFHPVPLFVLVALLILIILEVIDIKQHIQQKRSENNPLP